MLKLYVVVLMNHCHCWNVWQISIEPNFEQRSVKVKRKFPIQHANSNYYFLSTYNNIILCIHWYANGEVVSSPFKTRSKITQLEKINRSKNMDCDKWIRHHSSSAWWIIQSGSQKYLSSEIENSSSSKKGTAKIQFKC